MNDCMNERTCCLTYTHSQTKNKVNTQVSKNMDALAVSPLIFNCC